MRLSASIMAHPDRAGLVDRLQSALDRDIPVAWDERGDRWDTGSRAWRMADPDADYHLVIQDDAIPCRDLLAGLERALDELPEPGHPVSLYVGKVKPFSAVVTAMVNQAATTPTSWLSMPDLNWGVGIAMPVKHVEPALDWGEANKRRIANYDMRLSRYFCHEGLWTYYTWPSLVDHDDGPSLIDHGSGRHAHRFLGRDQSALDVDWTGTCLEMDPKAQGRVTFHHKRTGRTVVVPVHRAARYSASSSWLPEGRCPTCGRGI